MIRPTTLFTLDTARVGETARSLLLLVGRPVGRVPGSRIDAQFEAAGGFVVMVSYNDVFSAMESICFVDGSGTLRDQMTLGHETEQGLVTEITVDTTVDGEDAVSFAFPGNERHRLRVGCERRLLGLRNQWLHLDA